MSDDRTGRTPVPRQGRRETFAPVSGGLAREAAVAEITTKLERSRRRVAKWKREISVLEEIVALRR